MNSVERTTLSDQMKVSVLIAAFNEEQFIEECINSIFMQTHNELEVIVVNDGSSDETGKILDRLSETYSSLYVAHQENLGKVAAFNACYKLASGEIFIFVGADDILPRNSIEERVGCMQKNQSDLVRGRLKLNSVGRLNNIEVPRRRDRGNRSGGALLFNRRLAKVVFPIPEHFPNEDVWVNLIADHLKFRTSICSSIIYILRLHENNSFSQVNNFELFNQKYHDRELIIEDF